MLWITFAHVSPDISPSGDSYAKTPQLDELIEQRVMFRRAFSNGVALASARSTLVTGMYPPSIGTHHMRSRAIRPPYVRGITEFLLHAGYFTSNHSKTDYDWDAPASTWDVISSDWREQSWR